MKKQLSVWLLAGIWLLFFESLFGQQLKRQVLGSVGTNHESAGMDWLVASTVGQPPNDGTIPIGPNPPVCLRQGFQQPDKSVCGLSVDFEITPVTVPFCGTTYIFEYTGSTIPGLEISWSFGSNALPMSFVGLLSPNVAFSQAGVETVTLTVNTGTCMADFSSTVQVDEAPFTISADVTNAVCFGTKGQISLDAAGSGVPFAFKWADGSSDNVRPGLEPGNYKFTITDSHGCKMADEAVIKGATEPLRITPKVLSETCDSLKDGEIKLEIAGGLGPYSFLWSDDVDLQNRLLIGAGEYIVTVTDNLGCSMTNMIHVKNLCNPNDNQLPDIITPNGDGINDDWLVTDLDRFPNHEVLIYNRWGNLVFKSSNLYTPWKGVNSGGSELPAAAYFYVISLNDINDTVWSGVITIIR